MSLFDTVSKQVGGYIGGQIKRALPRDIQQVIGPASTAISQIANGNFLGAAATVANAIAGKFPLGAEAATQLAYFNTPTAMFGGLTPAEAQRIYQEFARLELARKNLFLVEVSDLAPESAQWLNGPSFISTDQARAFNLFVTDVEYTPWNVSGEKRRIGSAGMDSVIGFEPVEMQMTTYDDVGGSIKAWFESKAAAAAHPDGTFGVPQDYLVRIRILHAFLTNDSNRGGYENTYLMRPVSVQASLSRRDNTLQELQLSFTQFDSFRMG